MSVLRPIVIVPPTTKPAVLAELRKGGWIPLPTDKPVTTAIATMQFLESGDVLMSAMEAIQSCGYETPKVHFFKYIHERMKKNEAAGKEAP